MQLEAPFRVEQRFGHGAASANTASSNSVHLSFLRGPITKAVLPGLSADIGVNSRESGALACVVFIDRCVVMATHDDFHDAVFAQVVWGRLMKPSALVCRPEMAEEMRRYAEMMAGHGVVREVFTSSQSFEALAWAQRRAAAAQAQATYRQHTLSR